MCLPRSRAARAEVSSYPAASDPAGAPASTPQPFPSSLPDASTAVPPFRPFAIPSPASPSLHQPQHRGEQLPKFVIAVAQTVGVVLSGLADDIVTQISGSGWTKLDDGVAASEAAKRGCLVIGGLTAAELGDTNGHVVIVVEPTGPLAFGKYPYAYWGSENAAIREKGDERTTLNWAFSKDVRDDIHYASYSL